MMIAASLFAAGVLLACVQLAEYQPAQHPLALLGTLPGWQGGVFRWLLFVLPGLLMGISALCLPPALLATRPGRISQHLLVIAALGFMLMGVVPIAAHGPLETAMRAQAIEQLRAEGYLPIATFQHEEVYTWSPVHAIERDFKVVADAGAIIASGSQSHVPHYAEFHGDSFFHYGLGNLFFDQYGIAANTDIGFLDRHVFYDGKYLGVELIPIRFIDKVQPRLMTPEDKTETLAIMFDTYRMWWKDDANQPIRPAWK